jgi:hypothetical protein
LSQSCHLRDRAVRDGCLEIEADMQTGRKFEPTAVLQHKLSNAECREGDAQFPVFPVPIAFQVSVLDRVRQMLGVRSAPTPSPQQAKLILQYLQPSLILANLVDPLSDTGGNFRCGNIAGGYPANS